MSPNKQYRKEIPLLLVFSFLVYFNILNNEFVYDDVTLINDNPFINDASNFFNNLLSSEYYKVTGSSTYRPIAEFTYFLFFRFFGHNPFGYHVFNILFHGLNGILLFILMQKIVKRKTFSFTVSLLFLCHPAISEAVILVTFNDDTLSALFYLITVLLYIQDNRSLRFLSFISFFLALLAKEMAISLPLIILSYDFFLNEDYNHLNVQKRIAKILKSKAVYYAGYFIIGISYVNARFLYSGITSPMFESIEVAPGFWERLIYIPYQYLQFLKITIFPYILNADRIHTYPEHFFIIENLISVIIFSAFIIFMIRFHNTYPILVFGILWYLVTLFTVINIIPIAHPVAERYLYLPITGFCIIVSYLINTGVRKIYFHKNARILNTRTALLALLLIIYSTRTISRTRDWKDSETLWKVTLNHSPDSYRAHNNMGNVYSDKGLYDKAISEYLISIKLNPKNEITYQNLGNVYLTQKRLDNAIHAYRSAIKYNEGFIKAYLSLGVAYFYKREFRMAISTWEEALKIDPRNKEAMENIARAKERMEQ